MAQVHVKNPYMEQIMTPRQLQVWAVAHIPSVTTEFCTVKDYSKETMMLKESSNISGYSKNMSLLPQETKFRQK
jgi:hypothetical protein